MELLLNYNGRYKYRSFKLNSEYAQIHPVKLDRALVGQSRVLVISRYIK
jgi:hypothetical protein